jgi:hypothetical protein
MPNLMMRLAAATALPVFLSACVETTTVTAASPVVSKLSDGGVEVTLQGNANCVTRFNSEGALTYATEGVDGCSDSEIAAAKEVAIANIANL